MENNTIMNFAKMDSENITSPFVVGADFRIGIKTSFVLDTGAVVSVVPVDIDELTVLYNLNKDLLFSVDKCIMLKSASKHPVLAYFNIFTDVNIGGLKLEKFCCYLTDKGLDSALLGRDFLISTNLSHDIFSSGFDLLAVADNSAYVERCLKIFKILHKDYLSYLKRQEEKKGNESHKNYAAALRDYNSSRYGI